MPAAENRDDKLVLSESMEALADGSVRRLLEPALAHGWVAAWWAHDEVADELADVTVGVGPGAKLPLLNEVHHTGNTREGERPIGNN